MPQIWPASWVSLFVFFILVYLFFLVVTYFFKADIRLTQYSEDSEILSLVYDWKW